MLTYDKLRAQWEQQAEEAWGDMVDRLLPQFESLFKEMYLGAFVLGAKTTYQTYVPCMHCDFDVGGMMPKIPRTVHLLCTRCNTHAMRGDSFVIGAYTGAGGERVVEHICPRCFVTEDANANWDLVQVDVKRDGSLRFHVAPIDDEPLSHEAKRYLTITEGLLAARTAGALSQEFEGELAVVLDDEWWRLSDSDRRALDPTLIEEAKDRWRQTPATPTTTPTPGDSDEPLQSESMGVLVTQIGHCIGAKLLVYGPDPKHTLILDFQGAAPHEEAVSEMCDKELAIVQMHDGPVLVDDPE